MGLPRSLKKSCCCGTQQCTYYCHDRDERYSTRRPISAEDSEQAASIVQCGGLTYLPIILGQRRELGLLDNQASSNFVTYEFACSLGLKIAGESHIVTLGDGRYVKTRGTVEVQCIAMFQDRKRFVCQYEVLEHALHRIILGKPFIRMMKHVQPQEKAPLWPDLCIQGTISHARDPLTVGSYDVRLRTRILTKAGFKDVLATLDQASTAHFMSLGLVRELNLRVGDCCEDISVTTGDGLQATVLGACWPTMNLQLRTGGIRKLRIVAYVIKYLPFDLVLGKPIHHVLRRWDTGHGLEWHLVPELRLLLCTEKLNERPDPYHENQDLLAKNTKNQDEARKGQEFLSARESEDDSTNKQLEIQKKRERLTLLQGRQERMIMNDPDQARDDQEEIGQIERSIAPSPHLPETLPAGAKHGKGRNRAHQFMVKIRTIFE